MSTTRRAGMLLALVTAGISGGSVLLNGYAVRDFADPTTYTTAKNLVAALVLMLAVGAFRRAGAGVTRPAGPREWLGLGVIGLVGGSVPFVLFFEGLARASSPQAALLHKTLVIWVAALAVPILGERLQWGHWLAIGLLVVGQVGMAGGPPSTLGVPAALILAATALWSVEVVLAKRLLRDLSPWTVGIARMGLGSIALLGWLAARGDLAGITTMSGHQVAWVVATGVVLAGYVGTWFSALARAQAVDVTAVLVLAVPVTAVLGAGVDPAALAPQTLWLLAVVAGALLAVRLGWRSPPDRVSMEPRG